MCAAAKAMVKLLGGADGKTRGFFVMERTAGWKIRTSFFKWYAFVNHVHNVNAIKKLLYETFWYQNALRQIIGLKGVASVFYRMLWKQKRSD